MNASSSIASSSSGAQSSTQMVTPPPEHQQQNTFNQQMQYNYAPVMSGQPAYVPQNSRRMEHNDNHSASENTEREIHLLEKPSHYKTRLCMMHMSGTKPCEMGSRCKFAHGLDELRQADVVQPDRYPNSRYKTKLCKNYARGGSGFCNYGLRCEFVHPTDREYNSIPPYQRMSCQVACGQDASDYVVARQPPRSLWYIEMLKDCKAAGNGRPTSGDLVVQNNELPPHLRRC